MLERNRRSGATAATAAIPLLIKSSSRVCGTGSRHGASTGPKSGRAPQIPVGATTLVRCGAGAQFALTALHDPDAALDASGYAMNTQQCEQSATNPQATDAAIRVQKGADGAWTLNGGQCVAPLAPAKPVVTAADVRAQVVRLVPSAAIGHAPKTATLVNIQTIMWVAAPARRTLAAVQILGQRVDISLRLRQRRLVVRRRARRDDILAGQGLRRHARPVPDAYLHRLLQQHADRTGNVRLTATAQWAASFTVNGGAAQQIPGTVAGPTAASTLVVKQARSVLVPN